MANTYSYQFTNLFKNIYDEMVMNIIGYFNDIVNENVIKGWSAEKTDQFIIDNKTKICIAVTKMMATYLEEFDNGLDDLEHREADWCREFLFDEVVLPKPDDEINN